MPKKKTSKTVQQLLAADFDRLKSLATTMRQMAKTVDQFPEDIEYTLEMTDTLEEAYISALRLADVCNGAFEMFSGKDLE